MIDVIPTPLLIEALPFLWKTGCPKMLQRPVGVVSSGNNKKPFLVENPDCSRAFGVQSPPRFCLGFVGQMPYGSALPSPEVGTSERKELCIKS